MTLAEYESLTGTTVPASQVAVYTAALARVQSILETLLGFTLDSEDAQENLYNELGKTQLECACPNVDIDSLSPPDALVGAYRLYTFNQKDKYFHVDPFTKLYTVKLVMRVEVAGAGDDGVTIKTFDQDEIRIHETRGGITKYIEHCIDCLCQCTCSDCVQLAVEADWLETVPTDLQYVWADMVTYYANCKKDIKSETIGTHSYTRFDRKNKAGNPMLPEEDAANLAVIKRYAGPYGSVTIRPTI